jgi:Halocarboxylic acid dehydrogenase DehI
MANWKKGQTVSLVPLSQATGQVLEIYRDMQQVFGVPHISSFFQFLGAHPRFLGHFWGTARPIVQSQAFFSCSKRLRADAYTRVHSYFQVPNLKSEVTRQQFIPGASEELKGCIDYFCYSLPLSLQLASLLSESFEGAAGSADIARTPAALPTLRCSVELVDDDTAAPAVKSVYADIRTATNAEVTHTVYQAFARWPGFLQSYWSSVKPIAVSELFQYCQSSMLEDARAMVSELPGPIEFDASDLAEIGMNQSEAGTLIRVTNMFALSLAASLLNVSIARIAIEGGNLRLNPILSDEAEAKPAPEFPKWKAS